MRLAERLHVQRSITEADAAKARLDERAGLGARRRHETDRLACSAGGGEDLLPGSDVSADR